MQNKLHACTWPKRGGERNHQRAPTTKSHRKPHHKEKSHRKPHHKEIRHKKAIQKPEAEQRNRKWSNTTHNTTTTTTPTHQLALTTSKTTTHPPNSRWSVKSKGPRLTQLAESILERELTLSLNTSDRKDYQNFWYTLVAQKVSQIGNIPNRKTLISRDLIW